MSITAELRGAVARPGGPPGARTMLSLMRRRLEPQDLWTAAAFRYPRIAYLRLGREDVYLLNHPDVVREVYVTNGRRTMKGRALQQAKTLLGEGLLTSEDPLHRTQRRLVQPAFHHDRIARYSDEIVSSALARQSTWSDGQRLDVAAEMSSLTLEIVGRTLFGADLTSDTAEVAESLTSVMEGFSGQLLPGGPVLLRLPLPSTRRALRAVSRLNAVVQRLIDQRRMDADSGDVLSILLAARDQDSGSAMSDKQVRDEVMTLVLAGHETTANALTWTWWLLTRHPEELSRVRDELSEMLAGRPPLFGDVPRLSFTRAALAEGMRLYPPAWTVGRRLTEAIEVDGWTLPAGSLAVASQWVHHRDPRWWPAANTYQPSRWLRPDGTFDETAPGQPRGAWFPFGFGHRICIGEDFAWTEGVLVLATLLQRWALTDVPDRIDVLPAITLRPLGGLPATMRLLAA